MSLPRESDSALHRLQSRRSAGVPTLAVLVGPAGLAMREWLQWAVAVDRTVARSTGNRPSELSAAWVAEALPVAVRSAEAWLAPLLGMPARAVADRLGGMTRYDFDTIWRSLPTDTARPAAVAAHAVFARRFGNTSALADLSPAAAVRALTELVPEDHWPTLLVARDRPSADPNWLAGAVRAVEPLIAAVPRLAVGVVASEAEYVAFTDRPDGTRHQALAREGFVPVLGVSAADLVGRLKSAGLDAPAATLGQLAADGLSEEAAAAFVETAKAVANRSETEARSAAERVLFEKLNTHPPTAGFFRLNVELPFRHGNRPGEADLVAERLKVVVEVDGAYWHLTADQYRRDRRKDWLYQRHGYLILRFLAEDVVEQLSEIVTTVTDAVALRTTPADPRGAT